MSAADHYSIVPKSSSEESPRLFPAPPLEFLAKIESLAADLKAFHEKIGRAEAERNADALNRPALKKRNRRAA